MKQIELNAYAKINLSLDVIRKREDGYHEVSMVLHQIELHDVVTVRLGGTADGADIFITSDNDEMPTGRDNIAWKAANLMKELFPGKQSEEIHIHIEKKIPMAAGLAGGSADAAAVLRALNVLWECGLSAEKLMEAGVRLGADVPFCIMAQAAIDGNSDRSKFLSTCALAGGIGEKLDPLPPLKAYAVLLKPPLSVSTGEIYKSLDLNNIKERPNTNDLVFGLKAGEFTRVIESMSNVLENVSVEKYPIIDKERKMLQSIVPGNTKVMMSGSGPTVFALTEKEENAQAVYDSLKGADSCAFITKTIF